MTSAYPALVLNADFTPLRTFPLSVWDFARTMRNTLKDRVIVLETYDTVLRSPNLEYTPPSVVALKRFIHRRICQHGCGLFCVQFACRQPPASRSYRNQLFPIDALVHGLSQHRHSIGQLQQTLALDTVTSDLI